MNTLSRARHEGESRLNQEQLFKDKKRNVIVLIQRYLINLGFYESVTKLQNESSISLDRFDAADNMDLFMIVTEFEQFYEMKFGKLPKLVKKIQEQNQKGSFPKINKSGSRTDSGLNSTNTSISKESENKSSASRKSLPPRKQGSTSRSNATSASKKQEDQNDSISDMQIQGNQIQSENAENKETKDKDDFFDARVLKGLPDFNDVKELQELGQYLQRDIIQDNPNVHFTDIVGLSKAKELIKEAIILPLKYPQLFTGILEPWKGVLLFGPPGTGKTMLAKAVATECKTTFFNISASSVVSKWRGESEKLIRVLFELARHYQPSTIFVDEIDSIMSSRSGGSEHEGSRRMKTELLIQLDGVVKRKERVFLLAASNLPWDLDVALLRRLEKRILVPLPELETRKQMIQQFLPCSEEKQLDYDLYAQQTENYSGSDIKLLCKETAMKQLRKLLYKLENKDKMTKEQDEALNLDFISMIEKEDVLEALKTTKASNLIDVKEYTDWMEKYGSQ